MADRDKQEIVVPLTARGLGEWTRRLGYPDTLLMAAVLVIVGLSLVRAFLRGSSLIPTVLLFGSAVVGAGAYNLLRRSNATLYLRQGRIGTTNWLGIHRDIPVADVRALVLCSAQLPRSRRPLPMLLVISKTGRCILRFDGADRLDLARVRELAQSAGVELGGSWTDTMPLSHLDHVYPGAKTRYEDIVGWPLEHPLASRIGVALVTFGVFATLAFVTTRH